MANEKLILDMRADVNNMMAGFDKMKSELKTTQAQLSTLNKKSSSLASGIRQSFSKIGGTVSRLSAILGVGGFVGVVYKAIKASKEFESALSEVGTLIKGDSARQITEYKRRILDLSKTIGSSQQDMTKGLYQVISAGVKGSESVAGSMELLKVASKAGIAGLTSTNTAVDLLTTALNSYNLTTENSQKISDILFSTVRLGKTTLGELASSLGPVLSIANGIGVSFTEVNAAMVAMTKAGISTDVAASSLRGTLVTMSKPTKELAGVFKKFGYESAQAAIKERGLVGIMEMLRKAAGGSASTMSKLIPNVRALAGVSVMSGTGLDNLKMAMDEMGTSSGVADAAFKKMSTTIEQRYNVAMNQIRAAMIEIGDDLGPAMLDTFESFSKWVTKNQASIVNFFATVVEYIGKIAYGLEQVYQLGKIAYKWLDNTARKWAGVRKEFSPVEKALHTNEQQFTMRMKQGGRWVDAKLGGASGTGDIGGDVGGGAGGLSAEAKKWLAGRKRALAQYRQIEISAMDEISAMRARVEERVKKIMTDKYLKIEEKENAIAILRSQVEEKIAKKREEVGIAVAKKISDIRFELSKKRAENAKFMAGLDEYVSEKYGEPYRDRRAAEQAAAMSKYGDSGGQESSSALSEIGMGVLRSAGGGLLDMGMGLLTGAASPVGAFQSMFGAMTGGGGVDAMQEIADVFTSLMEKLPDMLTNGFNWLVSEGLPQIINSFVEHIPDILFALIDGATKVLAYVISRVPDIIRAVTESIPTIIAAFISNIPELIKAMVEMLTDMITGTSKGGGWLEGKEGLLPDEIPLLGWLHSGGMIEKNVASFGSALGEMAGAVKAHSGMFIGPELARDEVPIIGLAGESVLNRAATAALGGREGIDRLNKKPGSRTGGGNVSYVNQFAPQFVLAKDVRKVLDEMTAENINDRRGRTWDAVNKGTVTGLDTLRKR